MDRDEVLAAIDQMRQANGTISRVLNPDPLEYKEYANWNIDICLWRLARIRQDIKVVEGILLGEGAN